MIPEYFAKWIAAKAYEDIRENRCFIDGVAKELYRDAILRELEALINQKDRDIIHSLAECDGDWNKLMSSRLWRQFQTKEDVARQKVWFDNKFKDPEAKISVYFQQPVKETLVWLIESTFLFQNFLQRFACAFFL